MYSNTHKEVPAAKAALGGVCDDFHDGGLGRLVHQLDGVVSTPACQEARNLQQHLFPRAKVVRSHLEGAALLFQPFVSLIGVEGSFDGGKASAERANTTRQQPTN